MAGAGLGVWIGHYQHSPKLAASSVQPASVSGVPDDLAGLAARVGQMQSELLRLNALGERLVGMSGIDPEELDFQAPPPQGGAEDGPARDYTIREIASELGSLVSLVKDRERELLILERAISGQDLVAQTLPVGWPVRSGYITSRFGFRIHPIKRSRLFHQGVDIASPRGSAILAVADGVVTFSGRKGGYGRMVELRHASGMVTRYAHNQSNLVKVGETVRQGQQIATVGASGTATGPHVHFEVIEDGKAIDPLRYIDRRPRPLLASSFDESSDESPRVR
jgi:murein DD-endopeptidase MepM/ murein hydrolase activator NlpD